MTITWRQFLFATGLILYLIGGAKGLGADVISFDNGRKVIGRVERIEGNRALIVTDSSEFWVPGSSIVDVAMTVPVIRGCLIWREKSAKECNLFISSVSEDGVKVSRASDTGDLAFYSANRVDALEYVPSPGDRPELIFDSTLEIRQKESPGIFQSGRFGEDGRLRVDDGLIALKDVDLIRKDFLVGRSTLLDYLIPGYYYWRNDHWFIGSSIFLATIAAAGGAAAEWVRSSELHGQRNLVPFESGAGELRWLELPRTSSLRAARQNSRALGLGVAGLFLINAGLVFWQSDSFSISLKATGQEFEYLSGGVGITFSI